MITHIHHINFLVNDLALAITRYSALLGGVEFIEDQLDQRSVKTARTKLGDTWLILVQPTDEQSTPAQHLKQHGEGFFLLSLNCDDLDQEQQRINALSGLNFSTPERTGLEGWRIRDLPKEPFFGTQLQLTQDVNKRE